MQGENTPTILKTGVGQVKMWGDLTDIEKIQRLREVVKQNEFLKRQVNDLANALHELRLMVCEHEHTNGKIMVKAKEYYSNGSNVQVSSLGQSQVDDSKVYF